MKTNWDYIATYQEEVSALIEQELADLPEGETVQLESVNERLKKELILYTSDITTHYLAHTATARA